MLQPGDKVVYGIHGVCQILGIEDRVIDRKRMEYYVLQPLEQPETRFYVPAHNQAAVAKLRPLLTQEQLDALLHLDESQCDVWISDENHRKQRYRELINSGDRGELISMVRSLHKHKAAQIASGRKFHLCDENFLRDAEKLLTLEFSLVLDMPKEEIADYVKRIMGVED